MFAIPNGGYRAKSPLAEGRELKFRLSGRLHLVDKSPLAEGRELKSDCSRERNRPRWSPLAEGRELKYDRLDVRPREQLVAPRGGA